MARSLGVEYKPVKLTYGEEFDIKTMWHPIVDEWNPIYKDMMEPFNLFKFTCPRPPISLGSIDRQLFTQCTNVLRVPIKFPGSNIRLPKELIPIKDELIRLLQYEYFINPEVVNEFIHVTVDNRVVESGKTHRYGGFHGDGLQGAKFKQKVKCEHSYVYTNPLATHIALQPFFVAHINEARYNIFKEFDRQVKQECLYKLRDGEVYLIDPYVVHASPIIGIDIPRTFFRMTVSKEELLTPHNTVNPMFEGQNYPEGIEVREFVSSPNTSIPLDFYGITNIGWIQ